MMRRKREILLVIGGALLVALFSLVAAPILTKNVVFLLALPFAAALFTVLVLNVNTMFVFLLWTRSLMDPMLAKTKIGGGAGIGGLLNLFVILMMCVMVARFPKTLKGNRYVVSWCVFLGLAALTIPYAPMPSTSTRFWLNLCTYLCMFSAPFFIVKNENDKKFWVRMLLFSSFLPAFFANLGILIHRQPLVDPYARLQGTFTHPNILAFYLTLAIAVVFYVLRTRVIAIPKFWRFFLWLYLVDLMAVLIATQTRSAWMSCAAFFGIYALFKERKFLFIGTLALALLLTLPQVRSRLEDLSSGTGVRRSERLNSWAWRMRLWESAGPSIAKRLFTGHGLESFQALSPNFFPLEKRTGAPAHNVYVELIFETGIFGLLAYLWIYLQILGTFWRRIRSRVSAYSAEAVMAFAYVVGYLFVGASDNMLHYLAFNWYFWFFTGLMIRGGAFQQQAAGASQEKPPAVS